MAESNTWMESRKSSKAGSKTSKHRLLDVFVHVEGKLNFKNGWDDGGGRRQRGLTHPVGNKNLKFRDLLRKCHTTYWAGIVKFGI